MHAFVAFWVFAAIETATFGLGFALVPPGLLRRLDAALALATVFLCGTVAVVVLVLVAGYLGGLRSPLLAILGAAGCAGLVYRRAGVASLARRVRRAIGQVAGIDRVALGLIAVCVAAALAAGLKHPFVIDELHYHWAAPQYWAAHHHWVRSPFILTNGPAFMEWLYTLPALTGSYEAAHWIHATTLVLLILAVSSAARSLQTPWVLPAVAVASIPLALNESAWAYNDVAAAAFAATAFALLLSPVRSQTQLWLAGVALAAAATTKIFMLAAVPALLIAVLLARRRVTRRDARDGVLALVLLPSAAVLVLSFRGYELAGSLSDLHSQHIVRYGSPGWRYAPGYYPDLRHTLLLPLEPFFTGVLGNAEPWGGRTGVVLLILLPVAVVLLLARRSIDRQALVPLGGAVAFIALLGIITPRTRYLLLGYVLLLLFVFVVLDRRLAERWRHSLQWSVVGAASLGFLDSLHIFVRGI